MKDIILQNPTQNRRIVLISAFVLLLVIIFTILWPNLKTEKIASAPPFTQIEDFQPDSLLSLMTQKEKLAQIIFFHQNKQSTEKSVLFTSSKNAPDFPGLARMAGYFPAENKIQGINDSTLTLQHISALRNDSLLSTFYDFQIKNIQQQKGNLFFHCLPDFINNDSIQFAYHYQQIKNQLIKSRGNKLLDIFFFDFKKNFSWAEQVLRELSVSGVSGFYFSVRQPTSYINTLNDELGYKGLIFADCDTSNLYQSTLNLLKAGTDILVTPQSPDSLEKMLGTMLENGDISQEEIDKRVHKILMSKFWLHQFHQARKTAKPEKMPELLKRKILEQSITVVKNKNKHLPFKHLQKKYVILVLGENNLPEFRSRAWDYTNIRSYHIHKNYEKYYRKAALAGQLILALNPSKPVTEYYASVDSLLSKCEKQPVIVQFGFPENLTRFDTIQSLVYVNGSSSLEQDFAAQILFGGISAQGKLPYTISENLSFKTGDVTPKTRVKYTIPEDAGLDSGKLAKIDTIVSEGLSRGAFPGCQVLVIRQGKIVLDKAYGYHTYSHKQPVSSTDLFDIASVTKVAATTIAAMKMISRGKMSIHSKLGDFFNDTHIEYTKIEPDTIINIDTLLFSEVKNINQLLKVQDTINLNDSMFVAYDTIITKLTPSRNIFKVQVEDLLRHESGVMPVLPILPYVLYKINPKRFKFKIKPKRYVKVTDSIVRNSKKLSLTPTDSISLDSIQQLKLYRDSIFLKFYSKEENDSSKTCIARNMYLRDIYFDTLWIETKQLSVYSRKIPQYSDVNMILLQLAIDSLNNMSMHEYMQKNFYRPLGLRYISYQPLKYYPKNKIVPTERDYLWRNQLLRGHVHDPSAAMLGGISGNAGLFANARDLGILFEMIRQKGSYGGKQYLKPAVVDRFTKKQDNLQRGLGFDKPRRKTIIAAGAGEESFGHTGFTGTCVWVDPKEELVFVFLSNRVHPKADNWRLNGLKIRQRIHQAIYDAKIQAVAEKK